MFKKVSILLITLVLVFSLCNFVFAANEKVDLDVTIRDFKSGYGGLFETDIYSSSELVKDTIGPNKKPVYNLSLWQEFWPECTQANLDALFNDVSGVNKTTTKKLTLTADGEGFYVIDSSLMDSENYFPIDNELFGNEEFEHNFHFSQEAHAKFNYRGIEEFEFSGDDDVWVFIDGKLVIDLGGVHSSSYATISLPELVQEGILDIQVGETVDFDFFYMERHTTESNLYIRTNIDFTYKPLIASTWAEKEIAKAEENGLIPECLDGADLTKPITRAEFAALAVKLYEAMSGKTAKPVSINPFTDTTDKEVLKAYNLGITKGTSDTTFEPNTLILREQVATMLTRTIQATDSTIDITVENPELFADDANISNWARESVYFMATKGIINGLGDNKFAPNNTTEAEKARNYANATREQSILISVRSFENI